RPGLRAARGARSAGGHRAVQLVRLRRDQRHPGLQARLALLAARALPPGLDLLDIHRAGPARWPVLLESSATGTAQGRWDLLLGSDGTGFALDCDGRVRDGAGTDLGDDFLAVLDARWAALRQPREEPRWPFRGGWALLLGYELAAQVEPVLALPPAPGGLPVALALRAPAAILRDHATGECVALAEADQAGWLDLASSDAAAASRQPALPAWTPPEAVDEDAPARFTD